MEDNVKKILNKFENMSIHLECLNCSSTNAAVVKLKLICNSNRMLFKALI